jgi:hypothetical protein
LAFANVSPSNFEIAVLPLLQRNAADHGAAAESFPQAVDRVLGGGGRPAALINEIGGIGVGKRRQVR